MLEKYKLGKLVNVTRGASLSGDYYAEEGELIRLTLGNFDYKSNVFKENTSKKDIFYIGEVDDSFVLEKGDIITPLTEQAIGLLGSTARIPESGKYIQSQDVGLVKCISDKIDDSFLYYLLATPMVKQQLSAGAQQTSIRHTSPDKIKDCSVYIPDVESQRKIGKLLETLDRKIALNRKINAELEQMAKELYDYWFVQFDFPNAEGKPYKSSGGKMVYNPQLKREIPEGWEVKKIEDCTAILKDGTHNPPKRIKNGVPLLAGQMFGLDFLDYTKATFVSLDDYKQIHSTYHPQNSDFVMTKIGTVGKINYLTNNDLPITIHCNSAILRFIPEMHGLFTYYYLKSELFQLRLKAVLGQSIQEFAGLDVIGSILIETPPSRIIGNFNKMLDTLFSKKIVIRDENKQLTTLRDQLLPLLMNGQVKIK